jgi:type VI secretion system protein ImpA
VCEYYRRYEPSSPVPLLLERAQKLFPLDFFEIVNNLAPDSLSQIQLIVGKREDPTANS